MGDPDAIIGVGLLVLILTPMARVALCIFGFVKERNWLYVLVSSIVMAVLVYSILHVPAAGRKKSAGYGVEH